MRVVLTGGARGIGAAVATKLREAHHQVTVFAVSEPTVQVDHWIKTDLNVPESINSAIASAEGRYDALSNNAGFWLVLKVLGLKVLI